MHVDEWMILIIGWCILINEWWMNEWYMCMIWWCLDDICWGMMLVEWIMYVECCFDEIILCKAAWRITWCRWNECFLYLCCNAICMLYCLYVILMVLKYCVFLSHKIKLWPTRQCVSWFHAHDSVTLTNTIFITVDLVCQLFRRDPLLHIPVYHCHHAVWFWWESLIPVRLLAAYDCSWIWHG